MVSVNAETSAREPSPTALAAIASVRSARRPLRTLGTRVDRWYWIVFFSIWTFAPLARRMYDLRAGGFTSISPFSLLPLLVMVPPAWAVVRRWKQLHPTMRLALTGWLAVFVYGMAVGLASGNSLASVYAFAIFVLPAFVGAWFSLWSWNDELRLAFVADTLLAFMGLSAAYGLYQYVMPPVWDAMWLYATELWSAGLPFPYQLRPWGTLNSPGLFAEMMSVTLLVNLFVTRPRPLVRLAGLLLCMALLLVGLVRAAWLAFAIALPMMLLLSPKRGPFFTTLWRSALMAGALAAAFAAFGALTSGDGIGPAIEHVSDRFSSFDDLSDDVSANVRQDEMDRAIAEAPSFPLGKGLGVIGPPAKLNPQLDRTVDFDGGYIERLIEMGYPGLVGYVAVVAWVFVVTILRWERCRRRRDGPGMAIAATSIVVQFFLICMDSATDNHVDLCGLVFWIFTGMVFAADTQPAAPQPGAPGRIATFEEAMPQAAAPRGAT